MVTVFGIFGAKAKIFFKTTENVHNALVKVIFVAVAPLTRSASAIFDARIDKLCSPFVLTKSLRRRPYRM
jgi:hypothetical protein